MSGQPGHEQLSIENKSDSSTAASVGWALEVSAGLFMIGSPLSLSLSPSPFV